MRPLAFLLGSTLALVACSAQAQSTAAQRAKQRAVAKDAAVHQANAEDRRRPNTAVNGPESFLEPERLLRRVDGKLVDLRPIFQWKAAGWAAWNAYQPFTLARPLIEWEVVRGKVQFVSNDGDVVVSRPLPEQPFFLRNWPDRATAQTDAAVVVMARKVGTRNASSAIGGGKTLALYDYGELATAEETAALAKAEAELRAVALSKAKDAATEAEAKRKADIAARVEKSRADRAAKEAKEKLEAK